MNYRYLFKAKRIDNGEWIQGLLTKMWGQLHIINPDDENTVYPIDDSTICQYTGLKDKAGNLIWENDCVLTPREDGYSLICWAVTEAKWVMSNKSEELIMDFDGYWSNEIEVIGNRFDNPELLEVE